MNASEGRNENDNIFLYSLNNWEVFSTLAKPVIYERHSMVYAQGDYPNYLYYLKSGKVRIYLTSYSGAEKTLEIYGERNLFGKAAFFDKMPRPSSAKVMEDSEIIVIDQDMFKKVIQKDPEFAISIMEYLSNTIRMYSVQMDNIVFSSADVRIALYLIKSAIGTRHKSAEILMSQEEISSVIAASRITTSRILNKFARNNWIKLNYRKIEVIDVEALKKFVSNVTYGDVEEVGIS